MIGDFLTGTLTGTQLLLETDEGHRVKATFRQIDIFLEAAAKGCLIPIISIIHKLRNEYIERVGVVLAWILLCHCCFLSLLLPEETSVFVLASKISWLVLDCGVGQVTLPDSCFNQSFGLLGNNNGVATDDLNASNNQVLSVNASGKTIYEDFVLSWCVTDFSSSLFPPRLWHPCNTSWVPLFVDELDLAACPDACGNSGLCCLDSSEVGEDFAVNNDKKVRVTLAAQEVTAWSFSAIPPQLFLPEQAGVAFLVFWGKTIPYWLVPVVPHKAVAEVSKIGNQQERLAVVNHGWQSESTDGPKGGWSCVFWTGCSGCSGHLTTTAGCSAV